VSIVIAKGYSAPRVALASDAHHSAAGRASDRGQPTPAGCVGESAMLAARRPLELVARRRNGFVYLAFALYVVACGHLPTESGRGQAERGKSSKPVHKKSI
jgi:hypothetical protein